MNSTAACVLGLLALGPPPGSPDRPPGTMTAGDIERGAAISVSKFWNVTRSQLYRELRAHEAAGLVASEAGRSRLYRLTDAGRAAFERWLQDFVAEGPKPDQLRSPLSLTVFFGGFLDKDRLLRLLTEYRLQLLRELEAQEHLLTLLVGDTSWPTLLLQGGRRRRQATADWLAEVEEAVTPVP
jgi:DNA-binding PadR family transcriptional regulator